MFRNLEELFAEILLLITVEHHEYIFSTAQMCDEYFESFSIVRTTIIVMADKFLEQAGIVLTTTQEVEWTKIIAKYVADLVRP